jgi:orotidine-5'-phosphate decarboxylase
VQVGHKAEAFQKYKYGMNDNISLLINSSRGIIYASNGTDFAAKARQEAVKMQQEMEGIISLSRLSL